MTPNRKVQQLPDDLVARIAAGEVVERPASVLKELIENSVDAGARRVSIAIEGAGRTLLSVSDDGCGMSKEDALLALKRHATSKISNFDDLEALHTFGFRGEALPSLAAVSRFRLATRSAEEEMGWEFVVEGGKLVSERPVAREPGTTIDVRDIFFNTPARFKFLKSDATERMQCLRIVEELVFASLGTTFEIRNEKGKAAAFRGQTPANIDEALGALQARLMDAWGIRWGRGLVPVSASSDHFSVWGLTTNQEYHQATARNQFIYVNRRPVQNRRLTRAIYDGYVGQLPSMRHPGWVLFLDVDPRTIDVNVHPSKREVKLTHESEIFGFLVSAVRRALQGAPADTPAQFFSETAAPFAAPPKMAVRPAGGAPSLMEGARPPARPAPFAAREALGELYRPLPPKTDASNLFTEAAVPASLAPAGASPAAAGLGDVLKRGLRAVAQVRQTFILADAGDTLVIVDQHAAAEKVIYERLFANMRAAQPQIQMLLVPFSWETSLSVFSWVKDKLAALQAMGFAMEPFGGQTFLVKGYPAHLGEKFDLHSLLDGVSDVLGDSLERNFDHRIAAMMACKAAVKAGDALDIKECDRLLQDMARCEAPLTCPHGRPTMIRMPYAELEHKFRRT